MIFFFAMLILYAYGAAAQVRTFRVVGLTEMDAGIVQLKWDARLEPRRASERCLV